MPVYKMDENNFNLKVLQSDVPCVVKFAANSCHLCLEFKPIFRKLAQEFDGQFKFYSVDVSKSKILNEKYIGNKGVPTVFIFFKGSGTIVPDPQEPDDESWYSEEYIADFLNEYTEGKIL